MNAFQAFEEVKEASELEVAPVMPPIELSLQARNVISEASKHKKLIIAVLRFAKFFFGDRVDKGIDKAIMLVEILL